MKNPCSVRFFRILPAIAAIGLSSCADQAGIDRQNVPTRGTSSLSSKLVEDVNAYRRAKGSRSLQRHQGLDHLAQKHCEYLRRNRGTFDLYGKNVSHDGAHGRHLIAIQNLNMLNSAENVASIQKSPTDAQTSQSIVKMWGKSKNHDFGMRGDSWTHTGVGVSIDADGQVFATQIFGTMNLSHLSTRERFNRF